MNRRGFLAGALIGLGVAPALARSASLDSDPFTLGVASGDVSDREAVLWTRLAPVPSRADGGMPAAAVPVRWELARDARFSALVREGEELAGPELAHSVHVELGELDPGTDYWYRFRAGAYSSRVGRVRTLPEPGCGPASVRFVTTSCQNYTHGTFVAYRHIVRDEPDFIIHLGDYIYDTSFGETFRLHEEERMPQTVDDFRRRHALYKTDPDLQAAHAALPFFTTIDNHDAIEDDNPAEYARRAAAYQAWYEHMPVRGYPAPGANRFDLHRLISLGNLAQVCLLDSRQFRDQRSVCANNDYPRYGFGNYRQRCPAVFDDERSMLGVDQERWANDCLQSNRAVWNVLASPGPLQPYSYRHDGKDLRYIGSWDVFPANRRRIVQAMQSAARGHPLILSADVHSFWALDGQRTQDADERIPIAEFVSSSISANWPAPLDEPVKENLKHNPQVRYYNGNHRGYLLHDVDAGKWVTRVRALDDAKDASSGVSTPARFVVKAGESGFRHEVSRRR